MTKGAKTALVLTSALALAAIVVCLPVVQTAVANLYARRAGLPLTVERLRLGWGTFEVLDVNLRTSHGRWRLPRIEGSYSVRALTRGEVKCGDVRAEGWTFISWEAEPESFSTEVRGDEFVRTGAERLRAALELPFPISIEQLELSGEWRRHAHSGEGERTHLRAQATGRLSGSGPSRIECSVWAVDTTPEAQRVEVNARATVQLHYATPTRIDRLLVALTASAAGDPFPNGAVLSSRLDLRANEKDTALDLFVLGSGDSDARELIVVRAGTEIGTGAIKGTWSVDLNQSDLAPYALGYRLPRFSVKGGGAFAFDRAFRLAGDAEGSVAEVTSLPVLRSLSEVSARSVFDVTWNEGRWQAHRFSARVVTEGAEFALQLLQPLAWKPGDRPVPLNPEGDLAQVEWRQLGTPLVDKLVPQFPLSSEPIDGGVILGLSSDAIQARLMRALHVRGAQWRGDGLPDLMGDLVLDGRAALRGDGVQFEGTRIEISDTEGRLLSGTAQGVFALPARFLSGTAEFTADLAGVTRLRVVPGLAVGTGTLQGQVVASGTRDAWQAQAELRTAGMTTAAGVPVPRLTSSLRIDRNGNGTFDAEVPITLGQGTETSDLSFLCHVVDSGADSIVTSKVLRVAHLQAWLGLWGAADRPMAAGAKGGEGPFWDGIRGRLRLAFEQVIWPDRPERLAVQAEARVDAGSLLLDTLRLEHEQGGSLRGKAEIHHLPAAAQPYQFAGFLEAKEFDPSPYLRVLDPARPALVEGKFDVEIHGKGQAASWRAITDHAELQVNLTGRGGVFHAFDTASATLDLGKAAGGGSTLSNLIGLASSLVGKQDKRLAAGTSFLGRLANLAYDQATFELVHRPGADTEIREFSLIAPELRLRGDGVLQANSKIPWPRRYVRLQLDVAARGGSEAELRTLGLLGAKPDSLGYTSLGRPLRFDGTLRDLGTNALLDLMAQALAR
jgi:hypothetical protein